MKKNNNLVGIALIIGAILFLLSSFGYLKGIEMFNIIVTIILIFILLVSFTKLNYFGIFLPLAILLILYDDLLGIYIDSPTLLVIAAAMIAIGCNILFNQVKPIQTNDVVNEDEEVYYKASFGYNTHNIVGNNIKRITLENSFGQSFINIDNVDFNKTLDIYVSNTLGEINLYIPKEYYVNNNVSVFLGTTNTIINQEEENKIINIYGKSTLGNINIFRT